MGAVRRWWVRQVQGFAAAALVAAVVVGGGATDARPERLGPIAHPARAAFEDGLRVDTSTSYRLDPSGGAVHVSERITVQNLMPDTVTDGLVQQSFLDRFNVLVLGEAEGFSATRGGAALTVARRPQQGVPLAIASIDLVPNLSYRDTQTIELTYRIPALPPRGEGFSRVNAAFVTFPAFAEGDPGATDIEVIVPKGFEVELVGSPMEASDEGDVVVLRALDIPDPDSFLTTIAARDDDALVAVPVGFGDHELTVRGWPGDDEWTQFVASKVQGGVPALEDVIGLPWPGEVELDVVETASPYLYGYAGWYSPSASVVEIGDELDPGVIIHELSHLWFNNDLFADRWVNEGFAEVSAERVLARLGDPVTPPEAVDPADPGRVALIEWSDPDITAPISEAQEAFGYNASYAVLRGIAIEIGEEALTDVIVAADERAITYEGDGPPLHHPGAVGWQGLLDLLEDVGGSTTAAGAFAELVLPADRRALLDERTAARARYAELLSSAEGWSGPVGVREALAGWRFDDATTLMDIADDLLEVRVEVRDVLQPVGIAEPGALEAGFEGAEHAADLRHAASGALDASRTVASAVRAKRAASGPLAALGILGADAASDLDDARAELDAGRYDEAATDARAATRAYERATTAGALRLTIIVLLAAGLVVLVRARHRSTASGAGPDGARGVPAEPDREGDPAGDGEAGEHDRLR